jgi:hypothetical protein
MLLSLIRRVGNKSKRKQTTLLVNLKGLTLQSLLFLVVVLAIFNLSMSLLIRLSRISLSSVRRTTTMQTLINMLIPNTTLAINKY